MNLADALDSTRIIAVTRERCQQVVLVLSRELWTSWVHAGGRAIVHLSFCVPSVEIVFACSSEELRDSQRRLA